MYCVCVKREREETCACVQKKWQASTVTAPRWRACGAPLQWPFRFSARLDICMIKSWGEKVRKPFPQRAWSHSIRDGHQLPACD